MPIADDQLYPALQALENAATLNEANRLSAALSYDLHSLNRKAKSLHTSGQADMPAMREAFEALAAKPTRKHSISNIVTRWNALYDRFIFTADGIDFPQMVNPALISVAEENYPTIKIWCAAYKSLDKNIATELAQLQSKREIASAIDAYLKNEKSFIRLSDMQKQDRQRWQQLLNDLDYEIAIRKQFVESMQIANRVEEMFRLTLEMQDSTLNGVYRHNAFKSYIANIKLFNLKPDEPTAEEQIERSLQSQKLDPKASLLPDVAEANPLNYVAAPSHVQTVQTQYDQEKSADKTVIGKRIEYYYESEQTRHRHIAEIKIHTVASDSEAYVKQMVDTAIHFYLNCAKTPDLQPAKKIILNGNNAQALAVAFSTLGVAAKNLQLIGGLPSAQDIKNNQTLARVKEYAAKIKPEIVQLLSPVPEDGLIFKRFKQIKREVQRHGDTNPGDLPSGSSPSLSQLHYETRVAEMDLEKVTGVPELFAKIQDELAAAQIEPMDDKPDEEEDGVLRLE